MRKILYTGGLVVILAALAVTSSGCVPSLLAKAEQTADRLLSRAGETSDAATLRREVTLLNLLTGLELSDTQMRSLLDKAREAEEIRQELRAEGEESEADVVAVLSEFKEALLGGENVPDATRREWYTLHNKSEALLREYADEMARLAGEVEAALEDHQLYALSKFVPCVVPPQGELRIGQAGGTAAAEAALARVREIPARQFERHKVDLAKRALEKWKLHLPKGYTADEEAEQLIISVMEDARALSDVEFELQKAHLAGRLQEKFAPQPAPVSVDRMIAAHLLDARIIPLIEEMMR